MDLTTVATQRPLDMQAEILTEFEARLDGNGNVVVADPNNTFMFLIEMFSTFGSGFRNTIDREIDISYKQRVRTPGELYRHMSDFEYLNTFSKPAPSKISLIMEKKYLLDNAVDYDSNYQLVVVPKDTVFTVGKYEFGIHYPINIRIAKSNKAFLVTYDMTDDNPLQPLTSNTLGHYENVYNGVELITVEIPVYQFSKKVVVADAVPGTGFSKTYTYSNKFYVIRLFTTSPRTGKVVELGTTFSEDVYDPLKATARIKYYSDRKELGVNIPQIYFDSNMIGPNITVEIYTTHGELDYDITNLTKDSLKMNIAPYEEPPRHAQIFRTGIPILEIVPVDTRVTGGSNGYEFDELRDAVVNNTLYNRVPITPYDLQQYFTDSGYQIYKQKDSLTDRFYVISRTLTDSDSTVVPSADMQSEFVGSYLKTLDTVKVNLDDSLTILPTTVYVYNKNANVCRPIPNDDAVTLKGMSREDRVRTYNESSYVRSPYHLRLNTNIRYPYATSYDLLNPTVDGILFKKENKSTVAQMTCNYATIEHLAEGTDGYRVRFIVTKSDDLKNASQDGLVMYCALQSHTGGYVGKKATYIGTNQAGSEIYELLLTTDYDIDENHRLSITNMATSTDQLARDSYVDLSMTLHLVFLASTSIVNANTDTTMLPTVPSSISNGMIPLIIQEVSLTLGKQVDALHNLVDVQWTGQEYATYDHDVPATYQNTVYRTNTDGTLYFETDTDGKPVYDEAGHFKYEVLHSVGDQILDELGNPVYKARTGDPIFDVDGKRIVNKDREYIYYVNILTIDAKYYISEGSEQVAFIKTMNKVLEGYYSVIEDISPNLLERTKVFFRPIRTIGNARYGRGNGFTMTMPLELSFKFRIHVPNHVISNQTRQDTIVATIVNIIDTEISTKDVSMSEITSALLEKMSDEIDHIDVLGINGYSDLQTIVMMDKGTRPSIKQELYIGQDGRIHLRKMIDVEFVLTDSAE